MASPINLDVLAQARRAEDRVIIISSKCPHDLALINEICAANPRVSVVIAERETPTPEELLKVAIEKMNGVFTFHPKCKPSSPFRPSERRPKRRR